MTLADSPAASTREPQPTVDRDIDSIWKQTNQSEATILTNKRPDLYLRAYEAEQQRLEHNPHFRQVSRHRVIIAPALAPPAHPSCEGHHQDRQGPRTLGGQCNVP